MNGRPICRHCDDVCHECDGTGECLDCEGYGCEPCDHDRRLPAAVTAAASSTRTDTGDDRPHRPRPWSPAGPPGPSPAPGAICDECAAAARRPPLRRTAGSSPAARSACSPRVVDTPAGARIVVAQRIAGGWTPVSTVPATEDNLRALARPGATGAQPRPAVGGLW